MNPLHISTAFDSGAIEVLSLADHRNIQLNIRSDNASAFTQWFHFSLHGAAGLPVVLHFMNAGQCAYAKGWQDYAVLASLDRQHWFRIETQFDGQVMTAQTTPAAQCIYFAYFAPYSWEQHLDMLAVATASPYVQQERLGASVLGRDISLLRITDAESAVPLADRKRVWVIARQHPGESMASWFVEGLLERLLDAAVSVARALRQRCVFHVVAHMNPDGAVLGNLRTNAAGANLNREWLDPSMETSPEVFLVRQRMLATQQPPGQQRGPQGQAARQQHGSMRGRRKREAFVCQQRIGEPPEQAHAHGRSQRQWRQAPQRAALVRRGVLAGCAGRLAPVQQVAQRQRDGARAQQARQHNVPGGQGGRETTMNAVQINTVTSAASIPPRRGDRRGKMRGTACWRKGNGTGRMPRLSRLALCGAVPDQRPVRGQCPRIPGR